MERTHSCGTRLDIYITTCAPNLGSPLPLRAKRVAFYGALLQSGLCVGAIEKMG